MIFNPFSMNNWRRLEKYGPMILPNFRISNFAGLNTENKDIKTIAPGVTPDSLNWITSTDKDSISLRRGTSRLGTTDSGAGKITGLSVGRKYDGTEIPYFTYGRKIFYYDSASDNRVELGTDILPSNANGEDVSLAPYQNIAGSWVYGTSKHSSIYKLDVANPGGYVDQQVTGYRGYLQFRQSRAMLYQRYASNGNQDPTSVYLSYIDKNSLSDYTQITNEVLGTGDGTTKTFTHTLAGCTGKRTVFTPFVSAPITSVAVTAITLAANAQVTATNHGLSVNDYVILWGVVGMTQINNLILQVVSVVDANNVTLNVNSTAFTAYSSGGSIGHCEFMVDDKNGKLNSTQGGTGTINYATGVISPTFNTAPINGSPILANYYWEDATSGGVCDFTFNYASRIAGSGNIFAQFSGGGKIMSIYSMADMFYCFHEKNTWQLAIPADDPPYTGQTNSSLPTNLPYRDQMGIPYERAAYGGLQGVYFVNTANPNRPEFYALQLTTTAAATNVTIPTLLSKALDLSPYDFSYAVVYEWGIYVLVSFAQIRNGIVDPFNSRTLIMNKKNGVWDMTDYSISVMAEYMGTLLAGDPLTNNVYTLFSGFDDDGSLIPNYWTSGDLNLGWEGQKRSNRMEIDGLIQSSQSIDVYVSYDDGAFIKIFTIDGNGSYVNKSQSIAVGSFTIGSKDVGGGGTVYASPFWVQFHLNSDRFTYIRVKIQATSGGYAQINYIEIADNRMKTITRQPQSRQG